MVMATVDSKMESLSFEDASSGDELLTPKKKRKALSVANQVRAGGECGACRDFQVPVSPLSREQKVVVCGALDERGRLWLAIDALPWLLDYVRAEKETGGVDPVEVTSSVVADDGKSSSIYWCFQSGRWSAHAVGPDGCRRTTSRRVTNRCKDVTSFKEAKQAAYATLLQWVSDVQAGVYSGPV